MNVIHSYRCVCPDYGENPTRIEEFSRLNAYHVSKVAYFIDRLKNTPDGDGNLLDHSLVLYGSPMGDSHVHEHRRLPLFLAGHANGKIKGNLHRRSSPEIGKRIVDLKVEYAVAQIRRLLGANSAQK
jgi:hypothetical protein